MAQVAVQIGDEVASVLRASTIEGTLVRLPEGRLDRKTYQATDKVLQALGGKWDRRKGGHVFANDPTPKIESALSDGEAVDDLLTRKKRLQLFETPPALADALVSKLGVHSLDICLEPSAGRGRIVEALIRAGAANLCAIEIDADNAAEVEGADVTVADFLTQTPRATAIAMNPPFTRNQDIRHIRHAYDCLVPGGRMAAISSAHGFIGQEREAVEFREWLTTVDADVSVVPAGAFKESGTAIETRMIVIRKTA